jgi:hypothetical protein
LAIAKIIKEEPKSPRPDASIEQHPASKSQYVKDELWIYLLNILDSAIDGDVVP